MQYVYIIKNKINQYYVGVTWNIPKRINEHNSGLSKSTSYKRPWKLVFYSAFPTRDHAEEFEKYLKTHSGKAFLNKRLIKSQ